MQLLCKRLYFRVVLLAINHGESKLKNMDMEKTIADEFRSFGKRASMSERRSNETCTGLSGPLVNNLSAIITEYDDDDDDDDKINQPRFKPVDVNPPS